MRAMTATCILSLTVASAVSACASRQRATEPEPMQPAGRALSAAEHRERARQQERLAEQQSDKLREPGKRGALERQQARERAQEYREHAQQHEQAAAELERFEATECRAVPAAERAACPFLGPVEGASAIQDGARITLKEGADIDRVLSQMRCHAAFARARGFEGMESCPLYHRGVEVRLSPDGSGIDVTSADPNVAEQVQHEVDMHFGR